MGRKKDQGPKNLVKVIEQSNRFQRVFVTKDNRRLSFQLSLGSYEQIVSGFQRRGYVVEKASGEE